jgi:inositol hexakisphosphate/diphosphoinositol-pentakisphosphate kinase
MYPGGQGAGGDRPDVGLLRLHSTFRHDLKIYASDEGRVQMTAAAFAKGLLALDGELAPILVQMVKSANTNGLLDNDADSKKEQQKVKQTLHDLLAKDRQFTQEDYDTVSKRIEIRIDDLVLLFIDRTKSFTFLDIIDGFHCKSCCYVSKNIGIYS